MPTWIALFRGINVGGRNKMPMAKLTSTFEASGCRSVRTYIQSGNVVFTSTTRSKRNLAKRISDSAESQFGFRPNLLLLTDSEFRAAIANNPFADATRDPKTLHFFFLDTSPKSPDTNGLATLATSHERYEIVDSVFYLHAPDGFGRSKLAAGAERKLGVLVTARNYTTVHKLSTMLDPD